jgi:hypothetical protein
LLPSGFPPQSFLVTYPFIERHRLQLIHDARACLHHAVSMPEQLPQLAIVPARNPLVKWGVGVEKLAFRCKRLEIGG